MCPAPVGRQGSCPTARTKLSISWLIASDGTAAFTAKSKSSEQTSKRSSSILCQGSSTTQSASLHSTRWNIGRRTSRNRSLTKFKLDATLKVLRSPNMSAISSRAAHARRFRNHCLVHHRDRCRPPARISVLIHNSFLFLKWNRRFGSRAFTASTILLATGAGEFHKHSIFYPEAAGRKCLRPFQFGGRR